MKKSEKLAFIDGIKWPLFSIYYVVVSYHSWIKVAIWRWWYGTIQKIKYWQLLSSEKVATTHFIP